MNIGTITARNGLDYNLNGARGRKAFVVDQTRGCLYRRGRRTGRANVQESFTFQVAADHGAIAVHEIAATFRERYGDSRVVVSKVGHDGLRLDILR
jgi:outer membrane usher protein FimD/PapC